MLKIKDKIKQTNNNKSPEEKESICKKISEAEIIFHLKKRKNKKKTKTNYEKIFT